MRKPFIKRDKRVIQYENVLYNTKTSYPTPKRDPAQKQHIKKFFQSPKLLLNAKTSYSTRKNLYLRQKKLAKSNAKINILTYKRVIQRENIPYRIQRKKNVSSTTRI